MSDAIRHRLIADALLAAAQSVVENRATLADAVAAVASALTGDDDQRLGDQSARERLAHARALRKTAMLAEYDRLRQSGRGRNAAAIVARQFAEDPHDPVAIASIADAIRRWRRPPSRHRKRRVRRA